jgi:hypothetical protein
MIPAPLLYGLEHKSADIPRPKGLQAELVGLESSRQKPPHHWHTVAYGGLAEVSFPSQIVGITSHETLDRVPEGLVGRLANDMSFAEGAEQELACSPLAVVRAKMLPAVLSESTDLALVKFLKAEPFVREPFVQLNHDPNDALTRESGVSFLHKQAGKTIQVLAKRPATASTEKFGIRKEMFDHRCPLVLRADGLICWTKDTRIIPSRKQQKLLGLTNNHRIVWWNSE